MTKIRHLFAGLTLALAACIATPASALTTFLARAGTGTAGTFCALDAPCTSMSDAVAAAGVGGEVICLDKSYYGVANITTSVTISCGDDLWEASGQTFKINTSDSSNVSIEGLVLDSRGIPGVSYGAAITFSGQGSLRLHRVRIGNNHDGGLLFAPVGAAKLQVSDSIFYDNGTSTGGGIVINPVSGGTAQVALERVTVSGNAFGIAADGTRSTGGINMTIADSMIAGNSQDGIVAATPSGGAPIGVMVTNTKSANNAIGIRSIGANVTVRVKNSDVMGNSTGLSFYSGGRLLTFGNNAVRANATDGVFSGPVALQ